MRFFIFPFKFEQAKILIKLLTIGLGYNSILRKRLIKLTTVKMCKNHCSMPSILILGLDVYGACNGIINSMSAYFWERALQAI